MAAPRDKVYAVGSGQPIYAGRFGPARATMALALADLAFAGSAQAIPVAQFGVTADDLAFSGAAQVSPVGQLGVTLDDLAWSGTAQHIPPATVAYVGDSNSSFGYNNTPFYWANAVAGGVLAPIIGAGVSGDTIENMLARIDNAYTNASPGLAGAPEPLGWAFLRPGTNNARAGAMSAGTKTAFDSLLAKCLTYADKAVIFSVPPIGDTEAAENANVPSYNAYFAGKANGTNVFYVDDSVNLKDGSGNQIAAYFPGGIHYGDAGTLQAGLDGGAALAAILAPYGYASPVDSSVGSTTTQWHTNPQMAGTGGTNSTGGGGTLPNGYTLSDGAGAGSVAAASIVASDDSNPTPWLRITPSVLGSGGRLRLAIAGGGRSVTSSDPSALDCVIQIRFNAVNTTKLTDVRTWYTNAGGSLMVCGGDPTADLMLRLGVITSLTQTAVLRAKWKRTSSNTCASGGTIYIEIRSAGAFTGSMGSIDIRCHTIKG